MPIAPQQESFWAILLDDLLRLMPRHQGDTLATVLKGDQRAYRLHDGEYLLRMTYSCTRCGTAATRRVLCCCSISACATCR